MMKRCPNGKLVIVLVAEKVILFAVAAIIAVSVVAVRNHIVLNNKKEAKITAETETTTEIELETETETEIVEVAVQKETEMQREVETEPQLISMGTFTVTAYCSCEKCCGEWANNRPNGVVYGASGEQLIADYSIATDVDLIPFGETILINEQEYEVHDCGSAIQGKRIDIYMSSHEKALEWGVQNIEIFKVVER